MAPTSAANILGKRDCDYDDFGRYYDDCSSRWNDWGRWVALAAIITFSSLVVVAFLLRNSRRRRQHGLAPMYGTGWMGGKPAQGQWAQQHPAQHQAYGPGPGPGYQPPPPPYVTGQATGTTFNSNEGYYGGHGQGIELQHPGQTYQPQGGGENVYAPPAGPPPKAEGGGVNH
ncbi:hypothetical protein QTJ16_006624 [Diplocarpon rosae]|uniref:Uncharacterized protein n=1 Tax=Diplocarpon rosae TaxID=946125 RepID=A0AAD9SWI3_9HELO|nr:hypothetical protein QTJ16_006624 [Diplocarpon rosae]PBP23139.1 hypothetical protein BUE80_DR005842 [Diplocarpon rosae]